MLIKIRKAQSSDIDAMLGLLEELFSIETDFAFNADKSRKAFEMMIPESNDKAVFVGDCSGSIAGMCSIQTIISTAEGQKSGIIEDVVVARKFRRKGIASLLLDAAGNWAMNMGIQRLQLLSDRTNDAAMKFYHANCWSKTQLFCLRKYTEAL
jgi:ribosomal protein S18 acetylase RimI-like enzyme